MFPPFSTAQWLLACLAAVGIGISKSGLPGISLLHVVIFAQLFPGIASTGVVLPMLVAGDTGAVLLFRRHAEWKYIFRTLPPAVVGVCTGWWLMGHLKATWFNPLIGGIVLVLAIMQLFRDWKPELWQRVPHSTVFACAIGFLAGITTMLANAAGPVMGLYLISVSLPKEAFVGTGAWFFLLINLIKVPFSLQRHLITVDSLGFNALMIPCIIVGLLRVF